MTESYVVDASVVGKWFNRGEEFERESDHLRRAWMSGEMRLVAPSHLPFEVANSIWKNPNIGAGLAGRLAKVLVDMSPELNDLSEDMAERAMSVARRRHVTFYDASYLVLAKLLSVPLITADDHQIRVASGYTKAFHLSFLARS